MAASTSLSESERRKKIEEEMAKIEAKIEELEKIENPSEEIRREIANLRVQLDIGATLTTNLVSGVEYRPGPRYRYRHSIKK
jgi:hypothetical protein